METKYCVVCNEGSNREDWQGKDVVACDHHTKAEVEAAVKTKNTPEHQK